MEDVLNALAARLREADSFAALAAALIDVLGRRPGVSAIAVEAHDGEGPCAWFGSAGFTPPVGYLDGGAPGVTRLGGAPVVVETRFDPEVPSWVCALVGCGEAVGAVRLRMADGAPPDGLLVAACTLASVRVAQLGGSCSDAIGVRALTARQYEVSVLVARGSTNAEIARMLSISPDAVKKHVSRALVALEVSNRTELAAIAGRWRCASPSVSLPALHTELRPRRLHAARSRAA